MIGDGENVNNTLKTGSMDDIGSRMSHLLDLYNLWQDGLDICTRYDRNHPAYQEKVMELQHALKLLRYHLEKDYKQEEERRKIDAIKTEDIPKP